MRRLETKVKLRAYQGALQRLKLAQKLPKQQALGGKRDSGGAEVEVAEAGGVRCGDHDVFEDIHGIVASFSEPISSK